METVEFTWSQAAVDAIKDDFAVIRARILEETSEIANQARGWFTHTVFLDARPDLLCNGEQVADGWSVTIQLAEFTVADRDGVRFPRSVDTQDNEAVLTTDEVMQYIKQN